MVNNEILDLETRVNSELVKACGYYNYVKEFYDLLLTSVCLVFEKEYLEGKANVEQEIREKMAQTIEFYELIKEMVFGFNEVHYERAKNDRSCFDVSETLSLSEIAETVTCNVSLWKEFDESSQKCLEYYGWEAWSNVLSMQPLSVEDRVETIFLEQKECLEKFLPKKLEELKELQKEVLRNT